MDTTKNLLNVIKKDLTTYITGITNNIVHSECDATQIYVDRGRIKGLTMAISFLEFIETWTSKNPDIYEIPTTFLKVTEEERNKTKERSVYRIDTDTGLTSSNNNDVNEMVGG